MKTKRIQAQRFLITSLVIGGLGVPMSSNADVFMSPGTTVTVNGNLTADTVEQGTGSTLQGTGVVNAAINVNGTVSPGPGTATLGTGSLYTLALSELPFEINGTTSGDDHDQLQVTGTVSLAGPMLRLSGIGADPAPGEEIVLMNNDGTDAVTGSFVGHPEGSYLTLPGAGTTVEISYTGGSGNDVVLRGLSLFQRWAEAKGLVHGISDGTDQDPNNDGIENLGHFANDTDPLGSVPVTRTRYGVAEIDGDRYFTYTRPVRLGAVFSGTPIQASIDGVLYQLAGSQDLLTFDLPIVEAGSTLDSGLPALSDIDGNGSPDWEYRTFRFSFPIDGTDRAFIQDGVQEAP